MHDALIRQRALALHKKGDLRGAARLYRKILDRNPRDEGALHLLGCLALQRGDALSAVSLIEKAIASAATSTARPLAAAYHANLAEAFHRSGRDEMAEGECRVALRLDPSQHAPWNLLGLIHAGRSDTAKALECFVKALRLGPRSVDAMVNLALTLNRAGRHALAERYCRRALELEPRNPRAWTNLGMAMKGMRRLEDAKEAFRSAGEFPMARFNLGYTFLLEDDLAHGLPLYEARKELLKLGAGLDKPEWPGVRRAIAQRGRGGAATKRDSGGLAGAKRGARGRLLVLPEQGFGDTILMCRFFPMLLDHFDEVTALVPAPLERLIACVDRRIRIVTHLSDAAFDLWCGTMSLPFLLGIDSIGAIPNEPWIRVAPAGARDEGRPKVGLNWAGNPLFAYDAVRSTHLSELELLLKVEDVAWCSLHKGHLAEEAVPYGLPRPLENAADFADTAAVIAGLDLVISTETAVPNLSAAMGVPTCVLAAADVDWRWKSWYPDVVVCEQDAPGNWYGPIAKALEVIRERFAQGAAASARFVA